MTNEDFENIVDYLFDIIKGNSSVSYYITKHQYSHMTIAEVRVGVPIVVVKPDSNVSTGALPSSLFPMCDTIVRAEYYPTNSSFICAYAYFPCKANGHNKVKLDITNNSHIEKTIKKILDKRARATAMAPNPKRHYLFKGNFPVEWHDYYKHYYIQK